jgi:uncharacterized protein (DUF1778 family)
LWLDPPVFMRPCDRDQESVAIASNAATMLLVRSIHFRVSDGMYVLIQQGSEDVGASVAHFCREAAIARAVLWEARRGFSWTDPAVWDRIMEQLREVEDHDTRLRAELAQQRRLEKEMPPEEP